MDSDYLSKLVDGQHHGPVKKITGYGDILAIPVDSRGKLFWVRKKYLNLINWSNFEGIVMSDAKVGTDFTCIVVSNPRISFSDALNHVFPDSSKDYNSANTYVSQDVRIGENVRIGQNAVIESGCVLGNNVIIGHNSVIGGNSIIGSNVTIGSLTRIGGSGFGFERNERGQYVEIRQIGTVFIEDFVNIGDNCTVDRGAIGQTRICANVKIDNQVHIAHNCIIGRNTIVTAGVVLSGGVEIGENCWLGPQSAIINKVKFPNDSTLGIGSVLIKSNKNQGTFFGLPAKKI